MQCVCVCVPLWLSVIGLLRVMTTPVYPAECSSSIYCPYCGNGRTSDVHTIDSSLCSHPVAIVEVLSSPCKFL